MIEPERGALEVLTTDAQVEGVHFDLRFVPPDAIGHRALAVNLSDLAAMGAAPRAALLSLVLPDALEVATIDGLLDGLLGAGRPAPGRAHRRQHHALAWAADRGRDGHRQREAATRAHAGRRAPGDEVYVTGTIGDAVVGLRSLQARAQGGPTPCTEASQPPSR